jgi:hypothetical protein
MNFTLSCIQVVSQNEAFAPLVELLLLQDKKMIIAADRTMTDRKCMSWFFISSKNSLNDEKLLRYII